MHGIARSVNAVLKVAWMTLAILATLLVCVEGFAFGYYFLRRTLSTNDPVGSYVRTQVAKMPRDGYANPADQTWFGTYWKEFSESTYANVDWASYSNYHRRPFKGKYINVDRDGRRVTWNQDPADAPRLIRLALFGGSTIWGTGARDDFTIPSYVSKMLAERYPHRFRVINYGQDRYVSTQETITFLREIQMDRVPDIAVFYDGYNDAFAATQAGAAGIPLNEDDRVREFNILHPSRARDFYLEVLSRTNAFQLIRSLRAALWPEVVADSSQSKNPEALALDVVKVYSSNVEFVSAIAKRFGVAVQFYWEPSVYTKVPLTEPEESIIRSSEHFAAFYRQVPEAMRQNHHMVGRSNFRDISNVLNGYANTAFIDNHNVTELANEAIAREILAGLDFTPKQTASRRAVDPAFSESGADPARRANRQFLLTNEHLETK